MRRTLIATIAVLSVCSTQSRAWEMRSNPYAQGATPSTATTSGSAPATSVTGPSSSTQPGWWMHERDAERALHERDRENWERREHERMERLEHERLEHERREREHHQAERRQWEEMRHAQHYGHASSSVPNNAEHH